MRQIGELIDNTRLLKSTSNKVYQGVVNHKLVKYLGYIKDNQFYAEKNLSDKLLNLIEKAVEDDTRNTRNTRDNSSSSGSNYGTNY
ncbi:MAG: hypothetical protein DRQ88_05980 [Epsilonproteobacteria bacterium]|nr:MAG: hypothetical protein DRQ88_05980 [Campylobacterota bacterium]